jgi:nucleoid DNA-binding protein
VCRGKTSTNTNWARSKDGAVNRFDLAKIIHKRLGGSISYRKIYQAVGIIIEQIASDLINDQVVTVRRFGTLSPHLRIAHLAYNVSTCVSRWLKPRKSVKFHAHDAFRSLIRERQERFRQHDDDVS